LAVAEKTPQAWVYAVFYWTTLLGILLIDVYTFRPFFITFYGEEKIPSEAGAHAHESPRTMTVPMIILALGALCIGACLELSHALSDFLARAPSLAYLAERVPAGAAEESHWSLALKSSVLVLGGLFFTAVLYLARRQAVKRLTAIFDILGLYRLSYGKFFFDQLYYALVVWPLEMFARFCAWFDQNVIDRLVDFCGLLPKRIAFFLRPLQGGFIQFYALAMIFGGLLLIIALLL
ncbi:MAG: hypothetical protein ACWGMZ_07200, partial [Thermoguttaceae bacterium]